MGIAVPGAIAANLVHPDRKVLAITGDAGFLMNCQEFETAHRLGSHFVTLIFNDSSYGLIKWKQEMHYGHPANTSTLQTPTSSNLQKAWGLSDIVFKGRRPLAYLKESL